MDYIRCDPKFALLYQVDVSYWGRKQENASFEIEPNGN